MAASRPVLRTRADFEIVTTSVYLPNDSLALMLDGTNPLPDAKRLVRSDRQRRQFTEVTAKAIVAKVLDEVAQVAWELERLPEHDPQAKDTSVRSHNAGAEDIESQKELKAFLVSERNSKGRKRHQTSLLSAPLCLTEKLDDAIDQACIHLGTISHGLKQNQA